MFPNVRLRRPRYLVGLDVSLRSTGIAFVTASRHLHHREAISPPKDLAGDDFARQTYVVSHIVELLRQSYAGTLLDVVIEGPSMGPKKTGKIFTRMELAGMIKLELSRRPGVNIYEVAPNSVKMVVADHGHAGKDMMQVAIRNLYGVFERNTDIVDGIALADYGWRLLIDGQTLDRNCVFLGRGRGM